MSERSNQEVVPHIEPSLLEMYILGLELRAAQDGRSPIVQHLTEQGLGEDGFIREVPLTPSKLVKRIAFDTAHLGYLVTSKAVGTLRRLVPRGSEDV